MNDSSTNTAATRVAVTRFTLNQAAFDKFVENESARLGRPVTLEDFDESAFNDALNEFTFAAAREGVIDAPAGFSPTMLHAWPLMDSDAVLVALRAPYSIAHVSGPPLEAGSFYPCVGDEESGLREALVAVIEEANLLIPAALQIAGDPVESCLDQDVTAEADEIEARS